MAGRGRGATLPAWMTQSQTPSVDDKLSQNEIPNTLGVIDRQQQVISADKLQSNHTEKDTIDHPRKSSRSLSRSRRDGRNRSRSNDRKYV